MPYFVQRNPKLFFTSLVILLVGTILLSLNVGRFPISPLQLGQAIRCVFETECQTPSSVETVLWHIRTPRIFVACLVGAALAAAGATYQGMFKNPLVSPDILGVSSGAGLGASLAIFYNLPMFYVQLFAFSGGILAVLCVSMVASRSRNQDPILVLVLSGIAIGSLLGAGISLLKILVSFHPITFDYLLVIRQFHGCWRKRIKSTYPYFNTRYSAAFLIALALKSARFRRR